MLTKEKNVLESRQEYISLKTNVFSETSCRQFI